MTKPFTQIQQIADKFIGIIREYGAYNEYHSGNYPQEHINMVLNEIPEKGYGHPNDGDWAIPKVEVLYIRKKDTHEEQIVIELMLSRTPYSPYSRDSLYSDWLASDVCKEYEEVTKYREIYGGIIQVLFGGSPEFDKLATLLTRIVSVFGASESTRWNTDYFYKYTYGDMSLVHFPENLTPSVAIHNAVRDCMEVCGKNSHVECIEIFLNIEVKNSISENILISVDGESVSMDYGFDEEYLAKTSHYHNYQSLLIYHCGDSIMTTNVFKSEELDLADLFLTDYILALNPGASVTDIVVSALFDFYVDYEKVDNPKEYEAYRVSYLGDGTIVSEKSLDECMEFFLEAFEE